MCEPHEPPTIPRSDKVVKAAFVPKLDAFLYADFRAVEYRLLAFYLHAIGYPQMAEDFKNGLDPHSENAKKLLNKEEISDEDRQVGKVFGFASIYGAGPSKIGEMLADAGTILPEGATPKTLWKSFYEINPGIRKLSFPEPGWPDRNWSPGALEIALKQRGHLKTLWGRELHPEKEYKALNYLVQGCSADLLRSSIVRVAEFQRPYRSHMVLPVHDEIIIDAAEDEIAIFAEALPRLMSDERITNGVPIEVEIEISRTTWAEKAPYEGG